MKVLLVHNGHMFLCSSLHTYDYETKELTVVEPELRAEAVMVIPSVNAHESFTLSDWVERSGRHFKFFGEEPLGDWWPGDGIGAARASR
jgi:hypothetical protein